MNKTILYLIPFLPIFLACGSDESFEQFPKAKEFRTLDINPHLNTRLNYSQFVDSITYLPLKTPENVIFGGSEFKIIEARRRFFVFDQTKVVAFNSQGQYLFDCGKKGKGPGELIWPADFVVDSLNNTLEVLSNGDKKIARYNLSSGKFIDEFTVDFNPDNLFKVSKDKYLLTGRVVNPSRKGSLDNLIFFDKTKDSVLNTALASPLFLSTCLGKTINAFSSTNKGTILTRNLDNNIYLINTKGEIEVKYKMDFGKHNVPIEEDFIKKYKYLSDIIERTNYVVYFTGHYSNNSYLFFEFFIHDHLFQTIYDVNQGKVLFGDKIANDIDSGPVCSFVAGIHRNQLLGIVEPFSFLKHFDKMKKEMAEEEWSYYISKHPQIDRILNSTSPQDNPILMLCHLKEKFQN